MSAMGEQEIYRVVHPEYFTYDPWLREFRDSLPDIPRMTVEHTTFKDGSPWLHLISDGISGITALVPIWFTPPLKEKAGCIWELGNALTHGQIDGRQPIANRLIGLGIYIEARMDSDGYNKQGIKRTGEAIYAKMFADSLQCGGFTDLVAFEFHSWEATRFLDIPYLMTTANPYFAQYIREKGLIKEDSKIVSLDKGALQRCIQLREMTGLDLIVFHKKRAAFNEVEDMELVYGDPEGNDVIIRDDILDTGGSMMETCLKLIERGCKRIYLTLGHGVLSYPARENIKTMLEKKMIHGLVLTDSRPDARFLLEGIEGVEIISTAPLMAQVAMALIGKSVEEIEESSEIAPFILQPENKEIVWERFAKNIC